MKGSRASLTGDHVGDVRAHGAERGELLAAAEVALDVQHTLPLVILAQVDVQGQVAEVLGQGACCSMKGGEIEEEG
jgi:hypothetical protein